MQKQRFFTPLSEQLRLALIVVEDSVKGTSSGYNQANYYSGGNDLIDIHGVNWKNLPDPVPASQMVYNHVGRALVGGFDGQVNSVPATINEGTIAEYTFNYTVPTNSNVNNMYGVIILIDNATGFVLNSTKVKLATYASLNTQSITNFEVFPNPTTEFINVNFEAKNADYEVTIFDVNGKIVKSEKINNLIGSTSYRVSLEDLKSGNYLITLATKGESSTQRNMAKIKKQDALDYHSSGKPGKIEVIPTKPYSTPRDLSLAYSPGVAEPCLKIAENKEDVYKYTAKGNLVAVISNGTAVLGLGNIGPEASKPVMEGKGVLFKIFADIDVFDIEVDASDPELFIQTVKAIAPTFGGINLEDIKAPEAFEIERRLKEELDIPIMHDDQHGTAIISSAALLNALELANKKIEDVKILISGAGASAMSCTKLYHTLGAKLENIYMFDSKGLLCKERTI
jgi:23S rRNA pseudoU1915 N3-methylase RlmH